VPGFDSIVTSATWKGKALLTSQMREPVRVLGYLLQLGCCFEKLT